MNTQVARDSVLPDAAVKVPAATLGFWLIKILATTLGETGGDAVSMSMGLGYLAGTAIFLAIFVLAAIARDPAKACVEYGRTLGIGGDCTFYLRGRGRVVGVSKEVEMLT